MHGSAIGMDKHASKAMFRAAGLPVLDDILVRPDDEIELAAATIRSRFGDAVAVKPTGQGSALGTTPIAERRRSAEAIAAAMRFGGPVMIEPFAAGREITVGIFDVEGEAPLAWPAVEVLTPPDQWYDYENRYTPGNSEHIVPAPLPEATRDELRDIAIASHVALGLRDLSRADFIVTDDNEIWLLEINTMPGMTPTSLYPDGARAAGYDFPRLVDALVRSAFRRGGVTPPDRGRLQVVAPLLVLRQVEAFGLLVFRNAKANGHVDRLQDDPGADRRIGERRQRADGLHAELIADGDVVLPAEHASALLANTPVSINPTRPPTPCTERHRASHRSSACASGSSSPPKQTTPAMMPTISAPPGPTKPEAGVMVARPATMPVTPPRTLGLP